MASRGTSVSNLVVSNLWWLGPEWLEQSTNHSPLQNLVILNTKLEARKTAVVNTVQVPHCPIEFHKFSSAKRLIRTWAFVNRAIRNLERSETVLHGPLTASEIQGAHLQVLKCVQRENFDHEVQEILSNGEVSKCSSLKNLTPFLDDDGLFRVGGRLSHSDYPEEKKFLILLPKDHFFTWFIIRQLHWGVQQTLCTIQQQYWIPAGRNKVKQYVRQCVKCRRFSVKATDQQMGDLPEERITPSRPFTHTGLDYAGALTIDNGPNDSRKAYVALFICFATKALHLELVSDLTKDACLAAIRRFTSRRGLPKVIYSDNATNFIGTRNELLKIQQLFAPQDSYNEIDNYCADKGISCVTIPTRAPHFGGLWEAGVKSMKRLLRRQMGKMVLNFEELTTVLAQIEQILNSRPLTPLSTDPNDPQVLTPGHFLVGFPLTALPDSIDDDCARECLQRWRLIQHLVRRFWRRWTKEYLLTNQIRTKWQQKRVNLAVDDLVHVTEDNIPILQWPLGRVHI